MWPFSRSSTLLTEEQAPVEQVLSVQPSMEMPRYIQIQGLEVESVASTQRIGEPSLYILPKSVDNSVAEEHLRQMIDMGITISAVPTLIAQKYDIVHIDIPQWHYGKLMEQRNGRWTDQAIRSTRCIHRAHSSIESITHTWQGDIPDSVLEKLAVAQTYPFDSFYILSKDIAGFTTIMQKTDPVLIGVLANPNQLFFIACWDIDKEIAVQELLAREQIYEP